MMCDVRKFLRFRLTLVKVSLALFAVFTCAPVLHGQADYLGQVASASSYGSSLNMAVAVNSSGTMAVADAQHNRILRITPSGQVTTALQGSGSPYLQGGGSGQFQSVTIDEAGNIYAAQTNTMWKIAPNNSQTTTTLGIMSEIDDWCSQFTYAEPLAECEWDAIPKGMAVDPVGNVYISSHEAGQVLKVPAGGGTPFFLDTSGYNLNPLSLVCDRNGNLYIDNASYNDILVVTPNGNVSYIQPPGLNLAGEPTGPFGLTVHALISIGVDLEGNLYVGSAQFGEQRNAFYRISADGQSVVQMPTSGAGIIALGATDANDILAYVDSNSNVTRYSLRSFDFGNVAVGTTSAPRTLQFLLEPGVAVNDIELFSQGFDPDAPGSNLAEIARTGATTCTSATPTICSVDVTFTPAAPGPRAGKAIAYNIAQVSPFFPFRVGEVPIVGMGTGANPVFDSAGSVPTTLQISSSVLGTPGQFVTDGAGYTYVAAPSVNEVLVVAPGGATSVFNTGSYTLSAPRGVAIDGSGDLYIADTGNNRILEFSFVTDFERGTPFAIQSTSRVVANPGITLNGPTALAIDALGDLYVANTGNNEIDEISFRPLYEEYGYGTGKQLATGLNYPLGVAVDAAGDLYFTSGFDVYELPRGGAVTHVLGSPQLSAPGGLAVDAGGTLYVADFYNGVVELHSDGSVNFLRSEIYAAQTISVSGLGVITVGGPGTPAGSTGTVLFQFARTPPSLTFATALVGDTSGDSPQTVTVSNAGNLPVTFTALTYPTDFPEGGSDPDVCMATSSLIAGASCDLPITFLPQTANPVSELVTVTSNTLTSSSVSQSVSVSGQGHNGGQSHTITLIPRTTCVCYAYSSGGGYFKVGDSAGLPVTVRVLSGPMTFNGASSKVVNTTVGFNTLATFTELAAGSGVIEADQAGDSSYAPATPVQLSYTISQATITFRLNQPPVATQMYGSTPVLTYTLTGLVNVADKLQVYVVSGVTPASLVGTYTVTYGLTGTAAPSYVLASSAQTGPLTVTQAPLTVTAVDAYQIGGVTPGPFSYVISGFANGDTASVVSGSPSLMTTATASSPAGTYAITVGAATLTATNYTFTNLVNGDLNIFAPINLGNQNVGSQTIQAFSFPAGTVPPATSMVLFTGGSTTGAFGKNSFQCTPGSPGSCSANLTFIPTTAGAVQGALQLYGGISPTNVLVSIPVYGVGVGPQVAFSGGTQMVYADNVNDIKGIAIDGLGNTYFTVWSASTTGAVYKIPAGGGTPIHLGSLWSMPGSIAVDGSGIVYVADPGVNSMLKITHEGLEIPLPQLPVPSGAIAFDANGNFYLTVGGGTVYEVTPAGTQTIFYQGSSADGYPLVSSIAFSPSGQMYFADAANGNIYTASQGQPATVFSSAIPGTQAIAFDAAGNIYATATAQNGMGLYELTPSGTVTQLVSEANTTNPYSLALDPAGNVYIGNAGGGTLTHPGQIIMLDRADAPSVNFSTPTQIGLTDTADGPMTIQVSNIGNQPLVFTTPGSGSNPSYPANFPANAGGGNSCSSGTPLAAGGSCNVSATFIPSGVGANSGSVMLTDNALNANNAMQDIQFTGTGSAIGQTIGFTLPLSTVYYGVSPIMLRATGGASGNPVVFSVVSGPGSLNPMNNSMLKVTGTGVIVIAANQAGGGDYALAPQVTRSLTVLAPAPASISSPASGTALSGPQATFTWKAAPNALGYVLWLGTTKGASNLYASKQMTGVSATAANLPTNGGTIYARLATVYGGTVVYTYSTYTAAKQAAITSPGAGTVLAGPAVMFTWTKAAHALGYYLTLGTTPGAGNIFVSTELAGSSATVTNLPTNGQTIYARLVTAYPNNTSAKSDYSYTAATSASMALPVVGKALAGSKVTFTWKTAAHATGYSLWIGTAPGTHNLYASAQSTAASATVAGLPTNGKPIYARLVTVYKNVSAFTDYTYSAQKAR